MFPSCFALFDDSLPHREFAMVCPSALISISLDVLFFFFFDDLVFLFADILVA